MTSTVLEAENITPLLQEYKSKGRDVNVLNTPFSTSHYPI